MNKELSKEEFLEKKKDFSPFLVHLTREDEEYCAKDVLKIILDENTLRAYNHYCYFSTALNNQENPESMLLQNEFRVVCFTETPIDQIDVLLYEVTNRRFKPDPYGLVFKKDYIREKGGNPVFYVTRDIAKPIYNYLYVPYIQGKEQASQELCGLLALVTLCEEGNDWHWEREWRIVGNLEFERDDIFCGLCPEDDIQEFENNYHPAIFISPHWGINKILNKLVGR